MTDPYLYTICYGDTDAGGVVYFAHYLRLCERAWTAFLNRKGWSLSEKAKDGILLTVKRIEAEYLSPAWYGMTVEVLTVPREIARASFWFYHRIRNHATGAPIADIRSQMVPIRPTGKILRIPPDLRFILAQAEKTRHGEPGTKI